MMDSYYTNTGFDSTQLFRTQLYGLITSVWVDEMGTLHAVGDYIYERKNNHWTFSTGIADNFLNATLYTRAGIHRIRGNAFNDFIGVGERMTVMHYNGATGRQVGPAFNFSNRLNLYSVDVKGSLTIAVGWIGDRAGVIFLKR